MARSMDFGGGWIGTEGDPWVRNPDEQGLMRAITPEERSMMTGYYQSPEYIQGKAMADSQRKSSGGLFGGGLGGLLGLGLGIYGLGSLGGLWGAGAGAGASGFGAGELLGGAESLSGLSAANSLSAAGLGGAAASPTFAGNIFGQNVYPGVLDSVPSAAGTTGGGMDWTDILGSFDSGGMPDYTSPSFSMPAAVPESPAQLAEWGLKETSPGTWSLPNVPGSGSTAASWIQKIASDPGTWGKLLSTGLGMYGANKQASALQGLANKYESYGGPSRARFDASMSPGFDPMSIPGYAGALDSTSKSLLARLSAQGGNPFGNPGGLIDANKQIVAGTALPAIQEYQRLNANTGFGSSMNAAANLGTQAIGADAGALNALGYGINSLTNPQPSLADLLKQIQGEYKPNFGF